MEVSDLARKEILFLDEMQCIVTRQVRYRHDWIDVPTTKKKSYSCLVKRMLKQINR